MPSNRSRRRDDHSRLYDSNVCAFCGISDENEILYGKLLVSKNLTVHTNCMFFASGLSQEGQETQGIFGFLLNHIENELRRGKKLFCSYCKKRGATIGCCEKKCKKCFHLNCGIQNGSLHQFFGSFCSYCKYHSPQQKNVKVTDELYCYICCEEISSYELKSCLFSPCCQKNWSHKLCLQKYALSAGLYFFKCPFCNNNQEFVKEMLTFGICVPDKDASWELEEHAFEELLFKPHCDAPVCKSTKGREYCGPSKSGWYLLSCSYCGSHARHRYCETMKLTVKRWICQECENLEIEMKKTQPSRQLRSQTVSSQDLQDKTVISSSALCTLSDPPDKLDDVRSETVTSTSSSAMCTLPSPTDINEDLGNETVSSSTTFCSFASPRRIEDMGPETITSSSALCTSTVNDDLGDVRNETVSSSAFCTPSTPPNKNDNFVNNNTKSSALCNLSSSFVKDFHCDKPEKMKYLAVLAVDIAKSSSLCFNKLDGFESVSDSGVSLNSSAQIMEMDVSDAFVATENTAKNFLFPEPITREVGNVQLKSEMKRKKNIVQKFEKKKPVEVRKPSSVRKGSKKTKKVVGCCSDPNHNCIRKYFGQKCGKYRL